MTDILTFTVPASRSTSEIHPKHPAVFHLFPHSEWAAIHGNRLWKPNLLLILQQTILHMDTKQYSFHCQLKSYYNKANYNTLPIIKWMVTL